MQFRILGPLEVMRAGRRVEAGTVRQRQLLALLLLAASEPVSTDRLVEDMWTGAPPRTGRHTVQAYVHRLRKAFGDEGWRLETTDGPGYRLKVAADELDALGFRTLANKAHRMLVGDPQHALEMLDEALALWRGSVLADLGALSAFEPARAQLEGQRLTALEDRAEAALALGRHAMVIGELETLVAEHPFRERLWGQLMLALYRAGRQVDALAAYRHARDTLADELGIEPGPPLEELHRGILQHDLVLRGPDAARLRRVQHNLPVARTSFVGRDRDLDAVEGLLASHRLVTITGPPGAGKTRLAVEVARRVAVSYAHGAVFVPLAAVEEPRLVLAAIGAVLGVRATDLPLLDAIVTYLRSRRLLLVVDNAEHVVDGATIVGPLLDAARGVTALVTSRVPLRISGEQRYPLGPLPPPATADELRNDPAGSTAVALFADRARAVDPSFTLTVDNAPLVADIVTRLDRLPLAIELAAPRLGVFSLEELSDRLDPALGLLSGGPVDHVARQQTLRDAIAWSHGLLSAAEQTALRRLAVFRGGFAMDAAETVAVGPPVVDVSRAVASLVDASLVERLAQPGPARFAMLETIREFASEQLDSTGEVEDVTGRHARFYAHFMALAEPELVGQEPKRWLDRVGADHANLRTALTWMNDNDPTGGMLLAGRMWRFWQLRGHLAEGRYWLERMLDAGDPKPGTERVTALLGLAGVCYWQAELEAAEARYWEALDLLNHLDEWRLEADVLSGLVFTLVCHDDKLAQALPLAERFHRLAAERQEPELRLADNAVSAVIRLFSGDIDGARPMAEAGAATLRDLGLRWPEGEAVRAAGHMAHAQGRHDEAEERLRRALQIAWELDNVVGVATDLHWLGRVAVAQGRPQDGVVLAAAASLLRDRVGGGLTVQLYQFDVDDPVDAARRDLSDAEIEHAWAIGHAERLDDVVARALGRSAPPAHAAHPPTDQGDGEPGGR